MCCTESDNVPLQLETDSTDVSNKQCLLHSQHADFELHFELVKNGVGRLAGILEDVLNFALDLFQDQNFLHLSKFLL